MPVNIEIIEVNSDKLQHEFIMLPYRMYKDEPLFVPPLVSERKEFFDKKKNPFYRGARTKLFLARRDNKYVGRVATCINYSHNEFHNENVGFFGFFESVDDYEVASKLLKVAMITLKAEGMEKMRGPMSFSTNHEIGFLIDGFDKPPTIMMPYNYPYLPRLAEKFGLKKVMDLNGYLISKESPISERQIRLVDKLKQRNKVQIRTLNMSKFDDEVKLINRLYNQAWAKNWGFVPLAEDEFTYIAKKLKEVIDPEVVLIASINDEPAGFSLAVPDVNRVLIDLKGRLFPIGIFKLLWGTKVKKKVDGFRMLTMGVIPKYQKRGIDSIFYVETHLRGIKKGYSWAELSWILENNELMNRSATNMTGELYKKYRIVEMPI